MAILALLATLLLPALLWGKAAAKNAFCKNNLRQLAIAMDNYGNDFNEYPRVGSFSKNPHLPGGGMFTSLWNAALLPYVQTNLDLFYCSSYPRTYRWNHQTTWSLSDFPTNIAGNRPFCYGMNRVGLATWGSLGLAKDPTQGRKPSEIRAPSNMIAIGDNALQQTLQNGKTNKVGGWGSFSLGFSFGKRGSTLLGTVHNSGGNMVFLDAHVEWDRPDNWLEANEAVARRWNYDNQPHPEFWKQ